MIEQGVLNARSSDTTGFVVEDETGRVIGKDVKQARDAWANAFFKLGGRFEKGKAILPKPPAELGRK